jgi:hypothetical protein
MPASLFGKVSAQCTKQYGFNPHIPASLFGKASAQCAKQYGFNPHMPASLFRDRNILLPQP